MYMYTCAHMYACISIYPSIHPSIHPCIHLSIYLSIYLYLHVSGPIFPTQLSCPIPRIHLNLLWAAIYAQTLAQVRPAHRSQHAESCWVVSHAGASKHIVCTIGCTGFCSEHQLLLYPAQWCFCALCPVEQLRRVEFVYRTSATNPSCLLSMRGVRDWLQTRDGDALLVASNLQVQMYAGWLEQTGRQYSCKRPIITFGTSRGSIECRTGHVRPSSCRLL